MSSSYSYSSSVKSSISDEPINVYLIRPLAGLLVRKLFHTRVTPNQLTSASIAAGIIAAFFYLDGTQVLTAAAGICITAKDILDSADGQLARAKQQYSRSGRFLDSIGDFLVNAIVFAALTFALCRSSGSLRTVLPGILGFAGISLRVSYHVFYQTSFLHLHDEYTTNRLTEEIRPEDLHADRFTQALQQIFQFLYGWQDRFVAALDAWCRKGIIMTENIGNRWSADPAALKLSGFLGLGTELFVLMVFSVLNATEGYLWFNVFAMNAVWLAAVSYRKYVLAPHLRRENSHAHP